jgi:hypothetical protein
MNSYARVLCRVHTEIRFRLVPWFRCAALPALGAKGAEGVRMRECESARVHAVPNRLGRFGTACTLALSHEK